MLDRLYLNDGKGKLSLSAEAFPQEGFPTGSINILDFNGDGGSDILAGAQTETLAPAFKNLGMITDSESADLNQDGNPELILVGDAIPVVIFSQRGKF